MFQLLLPFDFAKAMVGFALVLGPRTLRRTWGTRPVPSRFCYETGSFRVEFSNFDRHFKEGLKLIIAGIAAQRPAKPSRT
jgi:hypothetical protein